MAKLYVERFKFMEVIVLSENVTLQEFVKDIADAIREKKGSSDLINPQDFATEIQNISGGGINNTSYNPVNTLVQNYLANVDYTDVPYNTSSIANYSEQIAKYRKDEPNGVNINVSGTKYALVDTVRNGSICNNSVANNYTFYNFIPGSHTGMATIMDNNGAKQIYNISTTTAHPIRMICVPSVYNVRDHGGWNCDGGYVKYGLIYRGGDFNHITSEDKKILNNFLDIGCEIDFMFAYQGGQLSESNLGNQVEYVSLPTNASYENLVMPGLYKDWGHDTNDTAIDIMKPALQKIFSNVANNIPTYYHCSLGADRTGTLGFVIDALLGMSQSDVDKEWELTSFAEAEKGSKPRARDFTESYWRFPDLVYYFMGGTASRIYDDSTAKTYKANHTSATYAGFGHNNLRDNVAQWAIDELGLSLSDINSFRRNMIVGNPADINL